MTRRSKFVINVILAALYLAAVLVAYNMGFDLLLMKLCMPWSLILLFMSNLLIHIFTDGMLVRDIGMMVGAGINVVWWLAIAAFVLRIWKR